MSDTDWTPLLGDDQPIKYPQHARNHPDPHYWVLCYLNGRTDAFTPVPQPLSGPVAITQLTPYARDGITVYIESLIEERHSGEGFPDVRVFSNDGAEDVWVLEPIGTQIPDDCSPIDADAERITFHQSLEEGRNDVDDVDEDADRYPDVSTGPIFARTNHETVRIWGNLEAFGAITGLWGDSGNQRDLLALATKPHNIKKWATVYVRYHYEISHDSRVHPRRRYAEITIRSSRDQPFTSLYTENLDASSWILAEHGSQADPVWTTAYEDVYRLHFRQDEPSTIFYEVVREGDTAEDATNMILGDTQAKRPLENDENDLIEESSGEEDDSQEAKTPTEHTGGYTEGPVPSPPKWFQLLDTVISKETHIGAFLTAYYKLPLTYTWTWADPNSGQLSDESGLMVCTDENYEIKHRIIVKAVNRHVQFPRHGLEVVEQDPDNDPNDLSTEPRELYLHKKISTWYPGPTPFTKFVTQSYHHSSGDRPHKMYIEWAPYNTLEKTLRKHIQVCQTGGNRSHLPEMFIWIVFRSLVRASSMLRLTGNKPLVGDYIHHDITPRNVLFDESSREFAAYKTPLLGNFGNYYALGYDFIEQFRTVTQGFWTPEDFGPYPQSPVRTDICKTPFQIGLTIWCLMRNTTAGVFTGQQDSEAQLRNTYQNIARFLAGRSDRLMYDSLYSVQLEDLVGQCLAEDPRKRPDNHSLERYIELVLGTLDNMNGGLRERDAENVHEWLRVDLGQDEFAVGSILAEKYR